MRHGSARITATLLTTLFIAGGLCGLATPAKAGFEFKPSASDSTAITPDNTNAAKPAAPMAAPTTAVDMTPLPVGDVSPSGNGNLNPYPMGAGPAQGSSNAWPSVPPQHSLSYGQAPAVAQDMIPPPPQGQALNNPPMNLPATTPLMPMAQTPPPLQTASPSLPVDNTIMQPGQPQSYYASVKGFGHDMPLALAMRQIVPTSYAYSFDGSVNPGMRINWQGGRPWNEVLSDALAPYGLRSIIAGGAVRVMPAHAVDANAVQPTAIQPTASAPMTPSLTVSNSASGFAPMPGMQTPPPLGTTANAASNIEPPQSYPHRIPHKHLNNGQGSQITTPDAVQDPGPPPVSMVPSAANPASSSTASNAVTDGQSDLPPPINMAATNEPMPSTAAVQTPAQQTSMVQPSSPAFFYTAPQTQPGQTVSAEDVAPMAGDPAQSFSPPPSGPAAVRFWSANQGDSLKSVLQQWCQQAGVQLVWNSPGDYKVSEALNTSASFTDALKDMLSSYDSQTEKPRGQLHMNTASGKPVLVIDKNQG